MDGATGRVPVRIRIGVTGHRTLPDETAIATRVDEILERLEPTLRSTETTPVLLEVVSPLGEGADRIVAERVLRIPSAILEAPLPLPRERYEDDFTSEGSRHRFDELLRRAERTWIVGGSDRVSRYQLVGEYVVDSCDLLIAVWDGEPSRGPGGTSDVLRLARRREMPVFVIDARSPFAVHDERIPASYLLVRKTDGYNREELPSSYDAVSLLASPVPEAGPGPQELGRCLAWAEPPFARADRLAKRFRWRFLVASRLMFGMSALAILAAAISVISHGRVQTGFAYVEVALMLVALLLWLRVRRRLHMQWITSRFLAERFRSGAFLAYAAAQNDIEPEGEYRGNAQEWLARAFREAWRSRPRIEHGVTDVPHVRDVLLSAWLEPQIEYYRRQGDHHARAWRLISVASAILFVVTIVAASLHASERLGEGAGIGAVLSISLPAFAGAILGIAGLEQHERHAERFQLMARRLGALGDRLRRVGDVDAVREVASRIETELRTEGDAWIDVMRFEDVELPV